MNLQQLEYILAVGEHRHFARAAAACHVTQPTLSMMIQKLEEELGAKVFDRSKQPVAPTPLGEKILAEAREVLMAVQRLRDVVDSEKAEPTGHLHIAVIPTLAPYLVPLFIHRFVERHPKVRLHISEATTANLIEQLRQGLLDAGILVTPLNEARLHEEALFMEPFYAYSAQPYGKQYILPEDIDPNELWLLEEGHCFRSQVMNFCELRKSGEQHIRYESGSIETLKRLVEQQKGITILPELATLDLDPARRQMLHHFPPPTPAREVSLVTHSGQGKQYLLKALKQSILDSLPPALRARSGAMLRVGIQEKP